MGRKSKAQIAAEKAASDEAAKIEAAAAAAPRPRLHKLTISNFRCIGSTPVEIELDDIVVLVGPNNAGKSSILRAYEVVMADGSSEGMLHLDDFPNGVVDPDNLPTIELETVVFEKTAPGAQWVRTSETGEMFIRERWRWTAPGATKKVGWDVQAGDWHAGQGPWGAANVAQKYRPRPHRIDAFRSPLDQADEILKLLTLALKERVKAISEAKVAANGGAELSQYEQLLKSIRVLQESIAKDATAAVADVSSDLDKMIGEVFPGYKVLFLANPEDNLEKALAVFTAQLKMGPADGHQTTIDRQGSGACRTLLWTALRILAERAGKKSGDTERPHLLLMDEPEICLHPDAIRDACRVLYDLPKTKKWQVMITTHSPVFIDLSRDNTSIVRVERDATGTVHGTTVFRPARAKLDDDDKVELKLLNICDPHVAEFFFGGRSIVVEGDTEYTAFRYVVANDQAKYKGVHVIRARGKACVKSLCKILNQFEKNYAVLHDSDRMKIKYKNKPGEMTNAMWTENETILKVTADARASGKVLLVASVPNFEEAFFGKEADEEKPYAALSKLRSDASALGSVATLLDALIDSNKALPHGALKWDDINALAQAVATFDNAK